MPPNQEPTSRLCRLLFPLEAAVDVVQPACTCALFHVLYRAVPGAGPLHALAFMLASNGVLALVVRAKVSPLPFRWEPRLRVGASGFGGQACGLRPGTKLSGWTAVASAHAHLHNHQCTGGPLQQPAAAGARADVPA